MDGSEVDGISTAAEYRATERRRHRCRDGGNGCVKRVASGYTTSRATAFFELIEIIYKMCTKI